MKSLKMITLSALIALSVTACNDEKNYSGTYIQQDNSSRQFTFTKSKNNDYQAVFTTPLGKIELAGVVKNDAFYKVSDNEKLGEFKDNSFINAQGIVYKK